VSGLQHMLRIQLEAQEAAARLEEERRKALEEAAALALEQRVHRYRLAVIEDYLVLRCPRCLKAFADYAGCDALTCGNCGCGFCALCLQGQFGAPTDRGSELSGVALTEGGLVADCGTDAHAHVRQADHRGNGGAYFGLIAGFHAFHALRRGRLVGDFLAALRESPEVRLRILEACRRELADLRIDTEAIRARLRA
jgi:hypothetical protein